MFSSLYSEWVVMSFTMSKVCCRVAVLFGGRRDIKFMGRCSITDIKNYERDMMVSRNL